MYCISVVLMSTAQPQRQRLWRKELRQRKSVTNSTNCILKSTNGSTSTLITLAEPPQSNRQSRLSIQKDMLFIYITSGSFRFETQIYCAWNLIKSILYNIAFVVDMFRFCFCRSRFSQISVLILWHNILSGLHTYFLQQKTIDHHPQRSQHLR